MIQKGYRGPGVFADYLTRNVEEDAYFAVLGRALWLATRFEAGCKSALMFSRFDENFRAAAAQSPPATLDDMDKLIGAFSERERSKTLGVAIRQVLPLITDTQAVDVLEKGRLARNFVAHEAAARLEFIIDDAPKRDAWLAALRHQVLDLAEGDRLTSLIISVSSDDPIPNSSLYEDYPKLVVEWVCAPWPVGERPT